MPHCGQDFGTGWAFSDARARASPSAAWHLGQMASEKTTCLQLRQLISKTPSTKVSPLYAQATTPAGSPPIRGNFPSTYERIKSFLAPHAVQPAFTCSLKVASVSVPIEVHRTSAPTASARFAIGCKILSRTALLHG